MPQSDGLLTSVIDALEGQHCVVSAAGIVVVTNARWARAVDHARGSTGAGDVPAGLTGSDFFDFCVPSAPILGPVAGEVASAVRGVLASRSDGEAIKRRVQIAGEYRWLMVRIQPVGHDPREGAVLTVIDITAGMATQEELHKVTEESTRLALVARHTQNAILFTDGHGVIEWVNDAFTRMTGFTSQDAVGVRRRDLVRGPFTRRPEFSQAFDALESGAGFECEFPSRTKDDRPYWVHAHASPGIANGRVVHTILVEQDITGRRMAQEQLHQSIHKTQSLADQLSREKSLLGEVVSTLPHALYWKDAQLRYLGGNQSFLALRGLGSVAEMHGRTEGQLDAHDAIGSVLTALEEQVLSTGVPALDVHATIPDPAGGVRNLLVSVLPRHASRPTHKDPGAVEGIIGVGTDVTRIGALERQLALATRLESIGQLAAGVAHEINTPIQYVADNTRFVSQALTDVLVALTTMTDLAGDTVRNAGEDGAGAPAALADGILLAASAADLDFLAHEIPAALTQSLEGLDHVRRIVRAMKDFSHPGTDLSDADLNRVVESTVEVSRNEWRYVADLTLSLDPEAGSVRCHEGELKQALLNIVVNAAHAIAEQRARTQSPDLGRITITTRRDLDTIAIIVSDDGPGMDHGLQERIFDPFFTTKDVGKGTGQGLSQAYATIVQRHRGTLHVTSAPDRGATFTITLPLNTTQPAVSES